MSVAAPSFAQLEERVRALVALRAQVERDARRAAVSAALHPECKAGPKDEDTLLRDLLVTEDVLIDGFEETTRLEQVGMQTLGWLAGRPYRFWADLRPEAHEQLAAHLYSARLTPRECPLWQRVEVHASWYARTFADALGEERGARFHGALQRYVERALGRRVVGLYVSELRLVRPIDLLVSQDLDFEEAYLLTARFKYPGKEPTP